MNQRTINHYLSLCETLRPQCDYYYNEVDLPLGTVEMSDAEYDASITQLHTLLEQYPDLILHDGFPDTIGSEPVSHDAKCDIPIQMYSTDNIYSWDDFVAYVDKYIKLGAITLSKKIDGIAFCLIIRKGRLVDVTTRGDGKVGTSLPHLKRLFKNIKFHQTDMQITGELHCRAVNIMRKMEYKTLQSMANSIRSISRDQPELMKYLHFKAYDYVYLNDSIPYNDSYVDRIDKLRAMGFKTVDIVFTLKAPVSLTHLKVFYDWLEKQQRENADHVYPIDGFVARPDSALVEAQAGATARIKRSVQAVKFQLVKGTSFITAITETVGEKGGIAFVADIDPIVLNGKTINKVKVPSVLNIPKVGDECTILLSGMTVPILLSFNPPSKKV